VIPNRITQDELYDFGYLQEANRRFFHPLGLALDHLGHVWDCRDIPEGRSYEKKDLDEEKFMRVQRQWYDRKRPRILRFGYMVQPISERLEYAGLPRLLAMALQTEFKGFMDTSPEGWSRIAKGLLDKITNAVYEESHDPEEVKSEEVDLLDLILQSHCDPALSRIEAVNNMIDDREKMRADLDEALIALDRVMQERSLAKAHAIVSGILERIK
jgi:hypothetical protein